VVVSADVGAGHDTAAAELARRLRGRGFVVDRLNLLDLLPHPMQWALREAYRGILRFLPRGYHVLFNLTSRSRMSVTVLRALLRPVRRRMRRAIPLDTRAVVSTYPFANQLLGPLRRQGRLRVPVITYVTDFAVHPTWLAPGVDVYCAVRHAEVQPAGAAAGIDVTVVQPLVSSAFSAPPSTSRRQARQRFGLPPDGRLALIVAGAWGAGDVAATAADVGATGFVQPVVVCGRNEALYHRLRRTCDHVFGWVDDMPTLMRAVDVVVENAGGLTCHEALACGVPVVTYRPIPGHGRANASILARSGLTRWVPTSEQLRPTLDALMTENNPPDRTRPTSRIDPAGLVAEVATEPGSVETDEGSRRTFVDSLGDAAAVIAALLQSSAHPGTGGR
jgi:UDP-N-acetylglucosamine:LPS N-acetylglucosamine transferase